MLHDICTTRYVLIYKSAAKLGSYLWMELAAGRISRLSPQEGEQMSTFEQQKEFKQVPENEAKDSAKLALSIEALSKPELNAREEEVGAGRRRIYYPYPSIKGA